MTQVSCNYIKCLDNIKGLCRASAIRIGGKGQCKNIAMAVMYQKNKKGRDYHG